MLSISRRTIIEFGLFILLVAGSIYLMHTLGLFVYFTDRQKLIELINERRGSAIFIFIGLQIVQVIAAPVPGEVTGFVGGIFFGTFWGIVFSTIGLTIGSWLAFGLARLLGRPLVDMVVNPETLRRYDFVMKHKGAFLAFLMFLIPGFPKDILCYLLGLGHMGQKEFLLVSTTGRLLGTTLLTLGGALFRDERYWAFFSVVGISLGAIIFALIYRDRIERIFRKIGAAERLKSIKERRRQKKAMRSQK